MITEGGCMTMSKTIKKNDKDSVRSDGKYPAKKQKKGKGKG